MIRRLFAVIATLLFCLTNGMAFADSLTPRSFEKQMEAGVAALNVWDTIHQGKDGLFYREWVQAYPPAIDVVKIDSILRPVVGTVKAKIKVMFGAKRETSAEAKMENVAEVYSGGVNEYTIDYDLKFFPKGKSWAFYEGTSVTSLQQMLGNITPVLLTPANLVEKPSVHTRFVGILAAPASAARRNP